MQTYPNPLMAMMRGEYDGVVEVAEEEEEGQEQEEEVGMRRRGAGAGRGREGKGGMGEEEEEEEEEEEYLTLFSLLSPLCCRPKGMKFCERSNSFTFLFAHHQHQDRRES
eukprot:762846-Hanusia_phi.AAC.1